MEHKIFTPEQKQRAKNADLIEFLKAYMGFEFKKDGHYYQCVQHNSLVVYPDRKGFVWNSRNISGGDTIDFVRKVEGKSYPEAIEAIIGEKAAAVCQSAPTYKSQAGKLVLPQKAEGKYSRVFAYLAETRGIAPSVIADFMKSKQLYQDTRGNCVFVGYDENGTAKFGSIRTTLTDKKYRPDCKYSDKRYAFSQIGTDTTRVYVFEAPIKALSNNIAMTGTKTDIILKAINEYLMELAKEQIQLAFEQSEKEVSDLHQRTKEGIETARRKGKLIGRRQGSEVTTKKSVKAKQDILKFSRDFGGTLSDVDCMRMIGIARNTYYRYKAQLKNGA